MGMRARIHRDRNLPVTWRDRGIRSLVQRRYILESHGGGVGPVTGQTRPARDRCRDSVVTESTRTVLDSEAGESLRVRLARRKLRRQAAEDSIEGSLTEASLRPL